MASTSGKEPEKQIAQTCPADAIEGIDFVDYRDESQIESVMSLVGRDLSEPYSSKKQWENAGNAVSYENCSISTQSSPIATFCIAFPSSVFLQSLRTIRRNRLPVSWERLTWKKCW